jgi:muconate cycloisomerase
VKITELTAFVVRIPLRRPIRHASHRRTSTDNVIVRCVLDDGTVGHGEGVPREYVTGESADGAVDLLRRSDLAAQLDPCHDFPQSVALAERLKLTPIPNDDRQCQGNAAHCALELAVLDAYGNRFAQPVSAATPLLAPEIAQSQGMVRYGGAITSARGFKLRLATFILWLYGFHQIKVKVGIEGYDDVKRLRSIRIRLGDKVDLRIDANEAWTPAQTVECIRALEPLRITSVEQPVPHRDVAALAEVRKQVATPLMLDESLCTLIDAERALQGKTCDFFNLRLSKCGGFIPSLRLAQFAKKYGLGYQLGCQIGETAILSAAGRHFACSVGGIRYLEGSYDRHLVREALATKDLTFTWGGKALALPGPGLGVTIDQRALDRVTVRKEAILG